MQQNSLLTKLSNNRFNIYALVIILLGISFRLIMFIQNRNLIIDEANVVRNVYERGYLDLLKPLSYEQYAPPLYLWALELSSHLFGYSEQAMRLVALLCGVGSLFLFWQLLKEVLPKNSLWLPLGLLCFAPILIKYSSEVKQYVPDAMVAIVLVLMALKIDIFQSSKKKFTLSWVLIGSLAIWASQPSVFILASVGLYYFVQSLQQKNWGQLKMLCLIGGVWLLQFGIYYVLILQSQINSDYLQNYHHEYFLFLTPASAAEWRHNWDRLKEIFHNTAGYYQPSYYSCIFLVLLGGFSLLKKSRTLFILLAGPILLTLLAAGLNQFSLIERVIIFILPFMMILLGFGFAQLLKLPLKVAQLALIVWGSLMLYNYNLRSLFYEKYNFQELTVGLDYIVEKKGRGKELYIDCASRDTYIYYTQVHPNRDKYASLIGAYLFDWSDDNFPEIAANMPTQRSFFVFTGGSEGDRERHLEQLRASLQQSDYFSFFSCFVYTFSKK